jgi:hypothetical protein
MAFTPRGDPEEMTKTVMRHGVYRMNDVAGVLYPFHQSYKCRAPR